MRIIGYARISRHTEESTSIERQREVIERECVKRGDDLVGIESDVDVSASRTGLDRPGLKRARAAVTSGAADAVMVWRLDRVARSVGDFMAIVDAGVEVISATEPIDTTTPMGRAMAQVLQVFAELESRTIGLRVAASKAYLRRVGRFPGGRVPYGYRTVPHPDGVGYALEPVAEEVRVIRRAVTEILEGSSLYSVAKRLNAEGLHARKGRPWTSATLKGILLGNPVLGRVSLKGGAPLRDERGIPVEVWEPIVTPEESARMRARITRGEEGERRKRAEGLLSGLAACGTCGRALTYQRRTKGREIASYRCRATERGLCSEGVAIRAEEIEGDVEAEFLRRFGRFRVTEIIESAPEVAGLAVIEEAIRDTLAAMVEEEADLPGLVERLTDLRAERARLKEQPTETQSVAVELEERFSERWASWDDAEKRRVLTSFGLRATVGSARSDIERVTIEFYLT